MKIPMVREGAYWINPGQKFMVCTLTEACGREPCGSPSCPCDKGLQDGCSALILHYKIAEGLYVCAACNQMKFDNGKEV